MSEAAGGYAPPAAGAVAHADGGGAGAEAAAHAVLRLLQPATAPSFPLPPVARANPAAAWQAAQLLGASGGDVAALLAALGHAPPPPPTAAEVALRSTGAALHAAVAAVLADASAAAMARTVPQPPPAQAQPLGLEAQLALALLHDTLLGMQPAARPASGTRRRNTQCQVDGCQILICEDAVRRAYNLRYRVCETHLRAAAVQQQGQLQRFCQKCSRFHPLSAYTGDMRTCAEKLKLQLERRRRARLASGDLPRARKVAPAVASADAEAEAESDGNGDEAMMLRGGADDSFPPAGADGRVIGSEQGAGADAVSEAAPERRAGAAARAAARAGRAAAASALGIQATQAHLAAQLSIIVAQAAEGQREMS